MSRGFTLIELAMVLCIVALMAVVVVRTDHNVDVEQQAKRLRSDIRYIKFLAETKNQRTRINFASDQYTLTLQNGTTAVMAPNSTTNVVTLLTGVTSSATNIPSGYLVFDGLGRPYTDATTPGTLLSATATITLTNGTDSVAVTVSPNTGEVQ